MSDSFVHLHVHTEYSMLDGASRISELVAAARDDRQPALAITDHGVLYGAIDFYRQATKEGIKPIIGMEAYLAEGSRFDRQKTDEWNRYNHITLLALNERGYKNLIILSSRGFLEGYWYKPRVDIELLAEHSEGILALSGCLSGAIPQALSEGSEEKAESLAKIFVDIFGRKNFYIELMDHGLPEQRRLNKRLVELARKANLGLVATNDSHYTSKSDSVLHEVLLCIQTGSTLDDDDRYRFDSDQFYFKTAAEMRALFSELPEACDATLDIAERVDFELQFGEHLLPKFDVPPGHDEKSYLRHLAFEGAKRRYGDPLPEHVEVRLQHELRVIEDMGFSAYFLIVADLVNYARRRGIRVGPGRGSASGCLVAYCLDIVQIDPLEYGLIFERFLNPGRRQMPDIDLDFDERYRGEIIRYAAERYGADHVAQIVTFSTIKARAAVRDAARVLGYSYALGDRIAKMMPPLVMGRSTPLKACLEKTPGYEESYVIAAPLREAYATDPDVKRVVDVALGLEGLRRQDSIHAAGVVISPVPLTEIVPVQRKGEEAEVVTQFDMEAVEQLGLLKIDILGLRNLSVIEQTVALVRESRGETVEIDSIPRDDPKTFELLQRGQTTGVFQLEGHQMRQLLRSLRPTSIAEIAAVIALYRPGPMSNIPRYVDRKHGREAITYPHPDLEPILRETYGVLVYQESVIEIASTIAGFDLAKADAFRKAVGKKIPELVEAQRDEFIEGCVRNGYDRKFAEELFALIEPFADYGFNKSHAYGYATISYQTAYLKAHYPAEYLAALLSSVKDDKDKTALYLAECRAMGITVKPPDVNTSEVDFAVKDGVIVYGLSGIRNVGEAVGRKIVEARRRGGAFSSFEEFCSRLDSSALNKRVLEALIKAGAFDSLGYKRKALFEKAIAIADAVSTLRRREEEGQSSLFGIAEAAPVASVATEGEEWDREERLSFEREMLGLYVSDHPYLAYQEQLSQVVSAPLGELEELDDGNHIFAGCLTALRANYTKRGELMYSFVLEDLTGSLPVTCFPKAAKEYGHRIREHAVVVVAGRLEQRDEERSLIAEAILDPSIDDLDSLQRENTGNELVRSQKESGDPEASSGAEVPGPQMPRSDSRASENGRRYSSNGKRHDVGAKATGRGAGEPSGAVKIGISFRELETRWSPDPAPVLEELRTVLGRHKGSCRVHLILDELPAQRKPRVFALSDELRVDPTEAFWSDLSCTCQGLVRRVVS